MGRDFLTSGKTGELGRERGGVAVALRTGDRDRLRGIFLKQKAFRIVTEEVGNDFLTDRNLIILDEIISPM